MTFSDGPLAVICLGYVGLPFAVEFGKHRPVIGFDIEDDPISEPRTGRDRTRGIQDFSVLSTHLLPFFETRVDHEI